MINAISPVNVNRGSYASFKGNEALTGQPDKKTVTSAQNAMIGLSAAAAIVVGGLLVKRHFDVKLLDKALSKTFLEKPVEKPKFFGNKDIKKIVEDWQKSGIKIESGNQFIAIPKSKIPSFVEYLKNKGYTECAKALQKVDMSDKGVMVCLGQQSDIDFIKTFSKTLRYIAPYKYQQGSNIQKARSKGLNYVKPLKLEQ